MNALQRLELLGEHAELVQAIPTLKGMTKLDSLERLSEIVALLGGVQKDVNSFIDDVLTQNDPSGELELFPVSQKEVDIAKQYGLDIKGFMHVLDAQSLKHALKRHRNDSENPNNNQRNLTVDDLKRIPEVLKNFDDLQVQKRGNNRSSLVYKKTFDDGRIECVERVIETSNKKNPRLVTKTAWVVSETGVISPSPSQVYTPDRQGLTSVLVAPDENQSTAETPETVGSLALENNISQNGNDVNSGALSQAFYDEFMLKNEMGELVFADDEFVDDVDIEMHEKTLIDGKTYAFGRALIAIDEVVLSRPMWSVVFGDFNHTLMAVSLFDSIANVDDFSVVAQVGVNLNNPKYKQYVLRLAVSDDGNIIAYPNETGDTALRHTIHYSEKDNVRALINTAIQSIENERKQKELLAQKQAKEAQMNQAKMLKQEIEQAFVGLTAVEIGRAKNQLLKTLTTREFGEQTYKAFIETLIDNHGYKPSVSNLSKRKGENAGDTKTVYRIANDDGRGYEINKTQYAYAKWYYEQKQAENEPAPQDDESQKPEHSPSNEDSAGALSQNEQENTMSESNYTQSDIDYLQSIINGTLDLETVDMDKMIEIGEKDEHDPMYEQALQVISEYLDKLTSV